MNNKSHEFSKTFNTADILKGITAPPLALLASLCPEGAIASALLSILTNKTFDYYFNDNQKKINNFITIAQKEVYDSSCLTDNHIQLIKDLINISINTIDNKKLNFIYQVYRGTLTDKNNNIKGLIISTITRIIRDISYDEIKFLSKYKNSNNFMIISNNINQRTRTEYRKMHHNGVCISTTKKEFNAFTGLKSLGIFFENPEENNGYMTTAVGKQFKQILDFYKDEKSKI